MTDIELVVDDELERRIRRALDAAAATSGEAPASRVSGRRRWAMAVASVIALAGLVAVASAVKWRHSDDTAAVTLPEWQLAIAPALPPGFDHVAILESTESAVTFEAIDLETSKLLIMSVERTSTAPERLQPQHVVPLSQAQSAPWTDPAEALAIELPDGRVVEVDCSVLINGQADSCPTINGTSTDPEQLRQLALTLAALPVEKLPPNDLALPHGVDRTSVATRAVSSVTGLNLSGGFETNRMALVAFGEDPTGQASLQVRAVVDYVPTIDPGDGVRRSLELPGTTITWQLIDNAIWIVSATGTSNGVPNEVLDRIVERLNTPPLPTLPIPPATTVPDAPLAMPDVRGLPLDDAQRQLDGAGIAWQAAFKPNADVPAGLVVESTPEVGATIASGDVVILRVSTGPDGTAETPTPP